MVAPIVSVLQVVIETQMTPSVDASDAEERRGAKTSLPREMTVAPVPLLLSLGNRPTVVIEPETDEAIAGRAGHNAAVAALVAMATPVTPSVSR